MKKKTKAAMLFILIGQMISCSYGVEDNLIIKTDSDRYNNSKDTVENPEPNPNPIPGQAKPLPTALVQVARENNIPAVQIAHFKDNQVQLYVYGQTDIASGKLVTEDHLFQAASISKAVAAYAFLRLYDRGIFDLDVPLNNYYIYDRVARANNPKNDLVTARHVLAHLTGYPNWVPNVGSYNSLTYRNSVLEPGEALTPGISYSYSGEGFTYLQEVLKHLTGKTLQQIIHEEVLEPFGMTNTSYHWTESLTGRNTVGHTTTDGALRMITGNGMMGYTETTANSAYTMLTSAKDFVKFIKQGMIDGKGLKPETYALFTTTASWPNGVDHPHLSRGLGMVIQKNEKGLSLFHSGRNPGFNCAGIGYPERNEGLIVFTNYANSRNFFLSAFPYFLGSDQTFHIFN